MNEISSLFLDRAGGRGGGVGGVVTLTQRTRDNLDTDALREQDADKDGDMDTYTIGDAIRDASSQLDTIGDGHRTRLGYWHTDAEFHWHHHTNADAVHRHAHPAPDHPTADGKRRLAKNVMPLAFADTAMFIVLNSALALLCVAGAVALIAWAWKEWGE